MDTLPAAQAVDALIHEYYKLVFHTIYGLTGNWEESQDLTQDTFHQALKGIDAARASSGPAFHARAWLLRIALNTVRMQQRRRALFSFIPFSRFGERKPSDQSNGPESHSETIFEQSAPLQPGGYGSTDTGDPADLIAEQDAVQRTMAQLPPPLRVCLLLSIVGGLSNTEIATLLEMKEPAIRQRLARARKQFQQLYLQQSGEELVEPAHSVHTYSQAQNGEQNSGGSQTATNRQRHLSLHTLPTPPQTPRSSYV